MMSMPSTKSAPCNRACRYAYPGDEAVFCGRHKSSGMVDVVNPSCKVCCHQEGVLLCEFCD